jgi:hypothetical protein
VLLVTTRKGFASRVSQRRAQWDAAIRLRAGHERRLSGALANFLVAQARGYGSAYRSGGIRSAEASVRVGAGRMVRVVRPSMVASAQQQARSTLRGLGASEVARFVDRRAVAFVDRVLPRRVRAINTQTVEQIRHVVATAVARGLGPQETQGLLLGTGAERSPRRALVIARHEVGSATSFADQASAEESGVDLIKVWLTANDGGPRHPSFMEGQERDLDEPFDVDGSDAMYPMDPSLPPEQSLNCRCSVAYVPKRSR